MGLFDNIKDAVNDRLRPADDGYYDDRYNDGYDDGYEEEGGYYDEPAAAPARSQREEHGTGLLGNPSRPDADSVSVYTRSGRQLSGNEFAPAGGGYAPTNSYGSDGAYRAADDNWRERAAAPRDYSQATQPEQDNSYVPPMTQPGVFGATGNTPGDKGLTAVPRVTSGKLPAYVLKPKGYDDVQMVVRRVRTNQPVILNFKTLNIDTAKRILDFSFGLACGVDGSVEELGDRVFVVLPKDATLSESDKANLRQQGLIR